MKRVDCLIERPANIGIAIALATIASGFSVIGITVLPVVGLLVAIPIFFLAGAFLFSERSAECEI